MFPIDPVAGLSSSEEYVAGLLDGYSNRFIVSQDRARVGGIENEIEFNGTIINKRVGQDRVIITSIDGLSDADIRDSRENNPGLDGETAFNAYYGGRTIVLNGTIRAGTLGKLRDMQEALKTVFSPLEELPLVFRGTARDKDLQIICRKSQPISMADTQQTVLDFKREFQITLRASDPRFTTKINKEYTWERSYPESVKEAIPSMYLRLNESSGSVAKDSSGFNRTGTISGAVYTASGAVSGGACYDFDGIDDCITANYMPFASGANARTFEAWVYRDTSSSTDTIIGSASATANNQFSIALSSGSDTLTVKLKQSGTTTSFTGTGISNGAWHHVVVVINTSNDSIKLYVNNVLKTPASIGASEDYASSPGNLVIGARGTSTDSFDGKIAEVAVYESALTADQVSSNYQAASKYFSSEVFMVNATNSGNYLADAIVKIEGPVYAATQNGIGVKVTNKIAENLNVGISSQSFETSAAYELESAATKKQISIIPNDTVIINADQSNVSAPYEVIPANQYILINTAKRSVNKYSSSTDQLIGSVFSQVNVDSEWLKLAPGNNPIYINCTASSKPKVTIYFKDTFI